MVIILYHSHLVLSSRVINEIQDAIVELQDEIELFKKNTNIQLRQISTKINNFETDNTVTKRLLTDLIEKLEKSNVIPVYEPGVTTEPPPLIHPRHLVVLEVTLFIVCTLTGVASCVYGIVKCCIKYRRKDKKVIESESENI